MYELSSLKIAVRRGIEINKKGTWYVLDLFQERDHVNIVCDYVCPYTHNSISKGIFVWISQVFKFNDYEFMGI